MRAWAILGWLLLATAAATTLPTAPGQAQKSADTLRATVRDRLPNLDFYHNNLRFGLIVAHHVWDGLIDRDPATFQLKPLLATSWRAIDDTHFEFTLRPDVHFQNGDPLSADDVVYTLNTVLREHGVAVPSNYDWIAGAERVDESHVRIALRRVFPAALEYLALALPIYPKAYRERVGVAEFSKHPIGTGPYAVTATTADTITLSRNDNYFTGPKGHPAIRQVVITEQPSAREQVAALLDGRADWIWQFDPGRIEEILAVPTLTAVRAESMRIEYLAMDAAGRTGPDDPFRDQRVREAVFAAIDRAGFARRQVGGGARVLAGPCYPTQFGCDTAGVPRVTYDPSRARGLLALAGYPAGFKTTLSTYLLPAWAEAIQRDLAAVGIEVQVRQFTPDVFTRRSREGRDPMELANWGSYSINDVSAILPYFFAGGPSDYVRDPKIEALVRQGGAVTDPDQRRVAYAAAIKRIMAQSDWLPLTTEVTTYAFSRELNFTPFPDEIPRFYLSSWK